MTMVDDPGAQAHLLHQLRNQLNLIGMALHAYRRDGQARHLEIVETTCAAAGELLERFGDTVSGDNREGGQGQA